MELHLQVEVVQLNVVVIRMHVLATQTVVVIKYVPVTGYKNIKGDKCK